MFPQATVFGYWDCSEAHQGDEFVTCREMSPCAETINFETTKFKANKQARTPDATKLYSQLEYAIEVDKSYLHKSKADAVDVCIR